MANRRSGPEGAQRRNAPDGQADSSSSAGGEGTEDDVEGHNFGQNAMISRNAAQSREREVQRNLKSHDLKSEAKRPFLKGR